MGVYYRFERTLASHDFLKVVSEQINELKKENFFANFIFRRNFAKLINLLFDLGLHLFDLFKDTWKFFFHILVKVLTKLSCKVLGTKQV